MRAANVLSINPVMQDQYSGCIIKQHSIPMCVDFPPGAAHMSRIFSPSLGARDITGRKLEAPWWRNNGQKDRWGYIASYMRR